MQLTQQQLAAALANFEKRLKSKRLGVDALNRLRRLAPDYIDKVAPGIFNDLSGAVNDYLTAKINWELIDIQELEMNVQAIKSQTSGILIATPGPVPVNPGR